MARRNLGIELTKHTLNLYRGDYDKIASAYPQHGAAVIIRNIVRAHVRELERRSQAHVNSRVHVAGAADLDIGGTHGDHPDPSQDA